MTIADGSGHYLRLPSLTTTERNALSAVNGDFIYNSTTGDIEAYTGGSWTGWTGNVTAGANIADHTVVRGDGGAVGIQDSGVTIDDSDNITGVTALTLGDVLTFSDGGTIDNTGADTLTITETNVVIAGNLDVTGTTTTINSTTLQVDDKNIELGTVAVPDDTTADGGGITLKGATDKTILWDNANDNWTFNQAVNLAAGLDFKIDNTSVLNATTLGGAVVSSSLTSVGTLTSLDVAGATTFYGASTKIGFDAGAALTIAVSDTTGVTAITHAGSGVTVTWTAPSFDFVGAFVADALTLSDVLTFSDGATIDNSDASTLQLTETNIDIVGACAADALTLSDILTFSDGATIDNSDANTLQLTETTIDLVGATLADALTLSDVLTFSDAGTIDNTDADTLTLTETTIAVAGILTVSGAATISGAAQFNSTITVGVDDTGYDVKFFGASAGAFCLYDESADALIIRGATAAGEGKLILQTAELTVVTGDKLGQIDFQAPLESDGTDAIVVAASIWAEAKDTFAADNNVADLVFATASSGAVAEVVRIASSKTTTFSGPVTLGVNDTGHDFKCFGATSGAYFLFDESVDAVLLQGGATKQMELRFMEDTDNGTNYVALKSPATLAANVTLVLPTTDGDVNQYLKTDGSGTLSWATAAGAGDVTKVGTPVDNQVGVWTGDGSIEGDANLTFDGNELDLHGKEVTDLGVLNFDDATELTIAAGAITAVQSYHKVDTQADGATDDLDTISGGVAGDILYLRAENTARTVVIKHNTGNIHCPYERDFSITNADIVVPLVYDGTDWQLVGSVPFGSATKIYPSVAQDVAKDAWVEVVFGTDEFDWRNESDLANNKITAMNAGLYLLLGSVYFTEDMADQDLVACRLRLNDASSIASFQKNVSGTGQETMVLLSPAVLSAGDSISFDVWHGFSENRLLSDSSSATYLMVRRIG